VKKILFALEAHMVGRAGRSLAARHFSAKPLTTLAGQPMPMATLPTAAALEKAGIVPGSRGLAIVYIRGSW